MTPRTMEVTRIGPKDGFHIEVRPGFSTNYSEPEDWLVTVVRENSGSTIQPEIASLASHDVALELAEHLYRILLPEYEREKRRIREQSADHERRRKLAEPARKRAEAERKAEARKAPEVEAFKCPECGHAEEQPDEFDEPAYECSQDGTTGRGEDGRRCEQCHKFAAKVAQHSCPSCESALEDGPETVTSKRLKDGTLVLPEDQ